MSKYVRDESIEYLRGYAEARAKQLLEVYDVPEDVRAAFTSDLTLEIVNIVKAFLDAADRVKEKNEGLFVSKAANRALRRKAISMLRR